MDELLVSKEEVANKIKNLLLKNEGPFSVVIADIDSFEAINNRYGTSIGDEVIKKLTHIFKNNLSETDLISRQGDEFCILLPGKGSEGSIMELEEIRLYLSDNTFDLKDKDKSKTENVYITISCGIASYPRDAKTDIELFRVADSAMFRAKKLGKNRICLSESESMVLKSSYFTKTQLDRLSGLSKKNDRTEAFLLREALDDLFKKYSK